ncbi:MAG TPA: hypothetical protein PKW95_21215 [bacterium]|nr:hypothetical protein [bacterium]
MPAHPLVEQLRDLIVALLAHGVVRDALGVGFSIALPLLAFAAALGLRWIGVSLRTARLLVRLAGGAWIFIAFYWIYLWPAGWLPPITLLIANLYLRRKKWTRPLREKDEDPPPLFFGHQGSLVVLMLLFWWPGYQFMIIGGVVAATLGRETAAVVNRRWGKRRFRFKGGREHTFEEATAMAVVTLAAIFFTNFFFARIPGVWFIPWCLFGALLAAAVATVTDIYARKEIAGALTPVLTSLTLYFYTMAGFR